MFRPSVRSLLGSHRFAPNLLCPLLTSARASQHLSMSVAQRFPSAPVQISPGIAHSPSRLCLSDIRHGVPYKFRALTILAVLPHRAASYPLPVRQASALPSASSRFPVAQNTLAVRLTLPLVGRVEDFHLQVSAPCRAHQSEQSWSDPDFRAWVMNFVRRYNTQHQHSALKFVTPIQRHQGTDIAVLHARKALYEAAKAARPERWRGSTRNWDRPTTVWLNPVRQEDSKLKLVA